MSKRKVKKTRIKHERTELEKLLLPVQNLLVTRAEKYGEQKERLEREQAICDNVKELMYDLDLL